MALILVEPTIILLGYSIDQRYGFVALVVALFQLIVFHASFLFRSERALLMGWIKKADTYFTLMGSNLCEVVSIVPKKTVYVLVEFKVERFLHM